MAKQKPITQCKILRQYQNGKTRVICRSHDWATRWLDNVSANFAATKHEKDVYERRGR